MVRAWRRRRKVSDDIAVHIEHDTAPSVRRAPAAQVDITLIGHGVDGAPRLKFLARPVAATKLEDSAGRARSAVSFQRSASSFSSSAFSKLLRETQRSHGVRIYPLMS